MAASVKVATVASQLQRPKQSKEMRRLILLELLMGKKKLDVEERRRRRTLLLRERQNFERNKVASSSRLRVCLIDLELSLLATGKTEAQLTLRCRFLEGEEGVLPATMAETLVRLEDLGFQVEVLESTRSGCEVTAKVDVYW